jgi:membrane-bound metal-dependent hydrolase YbcI (DUF457 family)
VPSPVGHALGGAIVGFAFGTLGTAGTLITVAAAVVPDIDFLWGRHNMETHSLGAAIAAGVVTFAWKRDARLAVAVTLAWSTHVLFDWLGSDDTPPLGVMALWPLNSTFYFANAFVFEAISRRYWLDNFYSHNGWAVLKEVLMLGPIVLIAFRWRARRRSRRQGTA